MFVNLFSSFCIVSISSCDGLYVCMVHLLCLSVFWTYGVVFCWCFPWCCSLLQDSHSVFSGLLMLPLVLPILFSLFLDLWCGFCWCCPLLRVAVPTWPIFPLWLLITLHYHSSFWVESAMAGQAFLLCALLLAALQRLMTIKRFGFISCCCHDWILLQLVCCRLVLLVLPLVLPTIVGSVAGCLPLSFLVLWRGIYLEV